MMKSGDAVDRGFVLEGEAVHLYAMSALASALRIYARTGMRVNRAYAPQSMMRAARRYLGESSHGIKARDYLGMSTRLWERCHQSPR